MGLIIGMMMPIAQRPCMPLLGTQRLRMIGILVTKRHGWRKNTLLPSYTEDKGYLWLRVQQAVPAHKSQRSYELTSVASSASTSPVGTSVTITLYWIG